MKSLFAFKQYLAKTCDIIALFNTLLAVYYFNNLSVAHWREKAVSHPELILSGKAYPQVVH